MHKGAAIRGVPGFHIPWKYDILTGGGPAEGEKVCSHFKRFWAE
jgi:hypothetical protein